jgi:RNA polymerase sigma-70 factor (ECF subfamily)
VAAAAPLIHAVARRVMSAHGVATDDAVDVAQDVFVRLCADDRRLLRTYDPARATLATWLAVVARSCAVDHLRRRRQANASLDDVPEHAAAYEDRHVERISIPPGLLTERQALVLRLLYDRDMDVVEAAALLKVDAQTVRSTHHKAMLRLRQHFRVEA